MEKKRSKQRFLKQLPITPPHKANEHTTGKHICSSLGLLSVGLLQQRLLIIRCLLVLLLGLLRGGSHGVGNRRHGGTVIGCHIHGHAGLRRVMGSGSLVHVLRVHATAVRESFQSIQRYTVIHTTLNHKPALVDHMTQRYVNSLTDLRAVFTSCREAERYGCWAELTH